MSNLKSYRYCFVPSCKNNTKTTPQKIFLNVPQNAKRRKQWFHAVGRINPQTTSIYFCCEDHFDMEKDTINYMKYKMGFSERILLADTAVPTKFNSQENTVPFREIFYKKKGMDIDKECLQTQNNTETYAESLQINDNMVHEIINHEELPKIHDVGTITYPIVTVDESDQVKTKVNMHYKSESVQMRCQNKSISTSPLKVYGRSTRSSRFNSPFKIEPRRLQPSMFEVFKELKRNDEKSGSDISRLENLTSGHLPSFEVTPSVGVTDTDSNVTDTNKNIEQLQCLKKTMRLIYNKPLMYVGIYKESYFLIHLLHKHTNIKLEHILLCLKKIRLNSTFSELGDNFGISLYYASKLFLRNIPIIASLLKPFIANSDNQLVKKNLPIAFRHNYHNVSCIIDCFEIDIQKPSKALHQALTSSEYKKGYTVKYFISCTPNGLVNYVSHGYGGRTSDVTIVENCNFLDGLQQGTCILADRGFKHLEQILNKKGMKILRSPSVNAGRKLSKAEVRQTEIIASLQIHIERVIRLLREFHMLKQHSVINTNILHVLDHVIIIACALINIQDFY